MADVPGRHERGHDAPGHLEVADLRLVLTDPVPQVVDAWHDAIAEASLDRWRPEVVHGSLLDADVDAIVSPGDSFATMDGGVDLAIVDRHGEHVRQRVQQAIEDEAHGELVVGRALVVPLEPARPTWLVAAPTMRVPMRLPAGTVNPYLAMRAAIQAVVHGTVRDLDGRVRPVREVVASLAVPGLGTGTGRVEPMVAARQMVAALVDLADDRRPSGRRWEQLVAAHRSLAATDRTPRRPVAARVSMSQPSAMLDPSARGTAIAHRTPHRATKGAPMQEAIAPARGHQLAGRFAQAVGYAATAHGDQVRKGTDLPYVSHLLAVAALVLEHGGSELQAVTGLLHDVVEDCGGAARLDDVRATFGEAVAQLVDDLSDAAPAQGEAKAPWRQRKQAYLAHLAGLVEAGSPAVLVSCCDKLHNAEAIVADASDPDADPGLEVFARFSASPADTAWYYGQLAATFRGADLPARLVVRFEDAVHELVRWATAAHAAGIRGRS